MPLDLSHELELDPKTEAELRAVLASISTLEDLVRFSGSAAPSKQIIDVVIQDEYTHDVIFAWDDTVTLVFDST